MTNNTWTLSTNMRFDPKFNVLFVITTCLIKATGVHKIKKNFFHYYLEPYESVTRVNIIESLQKLYQMKALSLSYKKVQNDFSKVSQKKVKACFLFWT